MKNQLIKNLFAEKENLLKEKEILKDKISKIEEESYQIDFLIEETFSNQLKVSLDIIPFMLENNDCFSANQMAILRNKYGLSIEKNSIVNVIGKEAQFVICVLDENEEIKGLSNYLKISTTFKEKTLKGFHNLIGENVELKGKFVQVYFNKNKELSTKETFICFSENEAIIFKVNENEIVLLTNFFDKNKIKEKLINLCN